MTPPSTSRLTFTALREPVADLNSETPTENPGPGETAVMDPQAARLRAQTANRRLQLELQGAPASILTRSFGLAPDGDAEPEADLDPRQAFDEKFAELSAALTRDASRARRLLSELEDLAEDIRIEAGASAESVFRDLARLRSFYLAMIEFRNQRRPLNYTFDFINDDGVDAYEAETQPFRERLAGVERAIIMLRDHLRGEMSLQTAPLVMQIDREMEHFGGMTHDLRRWEELLNSEAARTLSERQWASAHADLIRYWGAIRDRVTGRVAARDDRAPITASDTEITDRMRHHTELLVGMLSSEFSYPELEDFRIRLEQAIDNDDHAFLSNLTGQSVREYLQLAQMGHALLQDAQGEPGQISLRRMQAAQIFSELGLRTRVRETLALLTLDGSDPELAFQIAAIYQGAGLREDANRILEYAVNAVGAIHELPQLAQAMIHLNNGEVEQARDLLEQIPANEQAQEILQSLDAGQRHQRQLQILQTFQVISMDFIAQGREAEYEVVDMDLVERDTLLASQEIHRLVLSGEVDTVREAIRQVQESRAFPNFTLGTTPLDMRSPLDGTCTDQGNALNRFLDRVDQPEVSDAQFAQALFGLGASLEAYDNFAAAGEIYRNLARDPRFRSEARERLEFIPSRARINGALGSFAIFTSGSDPVTSAQNLALFLTPFAIARGAAVATEAAWVARGATLIRNPVWFHRTGTALRIGTEAAVFTLSSMALTTVFTGNTDIWTPGHFGREWASMVVTFTLLHRVGSIMQRASAPTEAAVRRAQQGLEAARRSGSGVELATSRLAAAQRRATGMGIATWGSRVGAFTASEYINEAIHLHDAQNTPFAVRVFASAVTDAQMIMGGRMINGLSGSRLERMERRTQQGYEEHARRAQQRVSHRTSRPSQRRRLAPIRLFLSEPTLPRSATRQQSPGHTARPSSRSHAVSSFRMRTPRRGAPRAITETPMESSVEAFLRARPSSESAAPLGAGIRVALPEAPGRPVPGSDPRGGFLLAGESPGPGETAPRGYDPMDPRVRDFETSLLDAEIAEVRPASDRVCDGEGYFFQIQPESVEQVGALARILSTHELPEQVTRLRVVLPEPVNGESRLLAEAANQQRVPIELVQGGDTAIRWSDRGVELNADRLPRETTSELLREVGPASEVRLSLGGVERISLTRNGDRVSLNLNLRGLRGEQAEAVFSLAEQLNPSRLRGTRIQVQGLSDSQYESNGDTRSALGRLTARALPNGAEGLFIQLDSTAGGRRGSTESLVRFSRTGDSNRLVYRLETSRPLSEMREIGAEYFAFETREVLRLASEGREPLPTQQELRNLWDAAFNHVHGLSHRGNERRSYQAFWTEPGSPARWSQALQAMAYFARRGRPSAADVRAAFSEILNFSEPTPESGLLGHRPYQGRALGDNAFELMRIFGDPQANLGTVLQHVRLMGPTRSVTLGGAFVGLVYKAAVLHDGPAQAEVRTLQEQIQAADALGERIRITVIPEDCLCTRGMRTPEWVLETLDAQGRTRQLLATEVKTRNLTRHSASNLADTVRDAVDQLVSHPFTHGVSQPRSLLVLRLTQVHDPASIRTLIEETLGAELRRRSEDTSLRDSAERMRALSVTIYFEGNEAAGARLLTYRDGGWQIEAPRPNVLSVAARIPGSAARR